MIQFVKEVKKMKAMMMFIGVITFFAGILPFVSQYLVGVLPAIAAVPTSGIYYSVMIIVIGLVALIYGAKNHNIFGAQKMLAIMVGLLIVLGGILPFIAGMNLVPYIGMVSSGPLYYGVIIFLGLATILYANTFHY